jgi:hypothetical protein
MDMKGLAPSTYRDGRAGTRHLPATTCSDHDAEPSEVCKASLKSMSLYSTFPTGMGLPSAWSRELHINIVRDRTKPTGNEIVRKS